MESSKRNTDTGLEEAKDRVKWAYLVGGSWEIQWFDGYVRNGGYLIRHGHGNYYRMDRNRMTIIYCKIVADSSVVATCRLGCKV